MKLKWEEGYWCRSHNHHSGSYTVVHVNKSGEKSLKMKHYHIDSCLGQHQNHISLGQTKADCAELPSSTRGNHCY